MHPLFPDRRDCLQSAAALVLAAGVSAPVQAAGGPAVPAPGPTMTGPSPRQRTPGKPGDFDFLTGHWKIHNLRLLDDGRWDEFDGEASCFGILGGVCSVEELRIPARKFSGMGLRLLDLKQQRWVDHWVGGKSGVVTLPGMNGSFEGGAGLFEADDEENGKPVKYRSVWDQITPRACRWQQASSHDGGRSWALNWSMLWTRVG